MAFDSFLADRIKHYLDSKFINYYEKKMFGGLCYMVEDKMCIGIVKSELMARIGEKEHAGALSKNGCKPMNFTGRPMNGYVFITPEGYDLDYDLEYWIDLSLKFNPEAKSSKRK